MSHSQKNKSAIGLDIGTSRIVAAFPKEDNQFEFRSELNCFVSFPASKLTESVLKREKIPHTVGATDIVVHGNESVRFADLLQIETRRPMNRGHINPAEPESLNVIREIVASLLGSPGGGRQVCFSIPAAPAGAQDSLTYHEASVRQVLTEMGYQARPINEGLAVIYAELEASNYTGVGISCGGGLCNVCLAYLAVPVLNFSLAKAGDYIDASAASVTGERANSIRMLKEHDFHLNGASADKIQQALTVYYDDMIQTLISGLKDAFAAARATSKLGRPVPLVLSGGTVVPQGFRERFETSLADSGLALPISEVLVAENPLHSTAKGALISALSEG